MRLKSYMEPFSFSSPSDLKLRPRTQDRGRLSYNNENVRPDAERLSTGLDRKTNFQDKPRHFSSERVEAETLSQQYVVQNGTSIRILSRALRGQMLRQATQTELMEGRVARSKAEQSRVPEGQLPNYQQTKVSYRANGAVAFFGANTNQGIQRTYNEDRVSAILNIVKPESRSAQIWPKSSFFGVYDGHGGAGCADFLRDNLHKFVIKQKSFPFHPKEALRAGFAEAEEVFWNLCQEGSVQKSGSCAIVLLVVGGECFIANVGDSRAVLSCYGGESCVNLSRDHKPIDIKEQRRILQGGGKIFVTMSQVLEGSQKGKIQRGPLRILPGRLSLTRSFGDFQAKVHSLGGNSKVLICQPEITNFRIEKGHDFVLLGCDGVFDSMDSEEAIWRFWGGEKKAAGRAKEGVEAVIRGAINKGSQDNITVVIVGLHCAQPTVQFREPRQPIRC